MTYLKKYSGPEPKPLTEEEKKEEVESLERLIEFVKTHPVESEPIIYRCPLCSIQTGPEQEEWINHLAQKHTSLELAQYIGDEDYRHDD